LLFFGKKFLRFSLNVYFCNDKVEIIFYCATMLDRTETINKLKGTQQYLNEHYGVRSMMLFGSLARNEQKEDSDVDICVDMVPNLFRQAGVKIYLQELLNSNVDVVRMRESMNPLFKQQILKYGIRIY
jgi:predicted nucleotidyltransferase